MEKYNKRFIAWIVKKGFWSKERSTKLEPINRIYAEV